MGYSELGAEPKRRLKKFRCVVLAEAATPTLPNVVGPKAKVDANSEPAITAEKVYDDFESFMITSFLP